MPFNSIPQDSTLFPNNPKNSTEIHCDKVGSILIQTTQELSVASHNTTFNSIKQHCTPSGNIPPHSISYHSLIKRPIASKPFRKSLLCQFKCHSTRFNRILLPLKHYNASYCIPLLQITHRSLQNHSVILYRSHFTPLHPISQPSTLFRNIPPRSTTLDSVQQGCIRFQISREPCIASLYNGIHTIPQHCTPYPSTPPCSIAFHSAKEVSTLFPNIPLHTIL